MELSLSNLQIEILLTLVKIPIVLGVIFTIVPIMVWLERRGSAAMQDRVGPVQAHVFGFTLWGFPHLVADAIKFFTKESFLPSRANRFYFTLAPAMVLAPSMLAFAVIPWADDIRLDTWDTGLGYVWSAGKVVLEEGLVIHNSIARLEAGVIYIFAISSLSVLGVILAGWASGSKYPLLGAVRTSSQMLSYELVLGLAALPIFLIYASLEPNQIAQRQGEIIWFLWIIPLPKWGFILQPVGCILFIIAAFAECNRSPFDLPEGEAELVAGYHTEYSGMKFAMFMTAEFVAMITMSALISTLFFGGWQVPYCNTQCLQTFFVKILPADMWQLSIHLTAGLQVGMFCLKTAFFLWLYVWVRWTVPRFRYDQLMHLGWKVLLPIGMANVVVTAIVMAIVYFR